MVKCPKCGADNPANKKFCGECATPLKSGAAPKTEALKEKVEVPKKSNNGKVLVVLIIVVVGFFIMVGIIGSSSRSSSTYNPYGSSSGSSSVSSGTPHPISQTVVMYLRVC